MLSGTQAAPASRSAPEQDGCAIYPPAAATTASSAAADTLVSLGKRAVATLALASFLTSAVSVGEAAFSSPTAGTGPGRGAFVAPAYAELEPLPLKSYSEEFSSALAPVNTVRGKLA